MTLRNKDPRAQGREEGSKAGGGGCSSLRVWGWRMWTMHSDGVEISIAGCVREMVLDPNTIPCFLLFFLFSFFFIMLSLFLGTRSFVQR